MKSEYQNTPILLVDDEEGIRRVLGIALTDMGYRVSTASNCNDAMNLFTTERPPIVITDIKLPGKDGISLLREIKQENPDTEVIMITGHGDLDLAVKSLKFEATDYITKPIHGDALEIALKRVHERIAMREQLRAYTEKLEQLVQDKTHQLIEAERMAAIGQTVAGLSHSIKNIAGGLKGGAFMLEKGIEQTDQKVLLHGWKMVSGNVEKIAKLSMDLLNYAKTTEIHCEPCDPNQPAREVFELMCARADALKIVLETDLSEDLGSVYLDPEGLYRALLNLVANALDVCEEDDRPASKKIIIRSLKTPGWAVEYQVEDNGNGMTTEIRKKLFQGFFSTKGPKGNGIGLMMTKNIIDKHKGQIQVRSTTGQGTIFVIRLPKHERSA